MRQIKLGEKIIDDSSECYVIAEIGCNHQGDLDEAKELFLAAKNAGADAVKLQKRDNKTLYTKEMFDNPYENRSSYGETYGLHREYLEFGQKEYVELSSYARDIGVDFFATAFDITSADFLEKLDMPMYKIASADLISIPLLEHVAAFGKPMIISTGGGKMEDVKRARDAIMPINDQLCIMQCTAGYPPSWDQLNLRVIETFRKEFPENVIGFSSHDSGIAMGVASYLLGVRVIEKHFTLNRALKGTDHAFSLEPLGMSKMVRDLGRLKSALGDGVKTPYESEVYPIQKMGKSLVALRDLPSGHVLSNDDIAMKSPGGGLPPYEMDKIIGMKLKKKMMEDDRFSIEILAEEEKA